MRVFLLGTLSAILLGLLISAGSLVKARRGHVAVPLPEVAEEDVPATAAVATTLRRREPLPAVGSGGCAPRPGWACWRGRLRLSAEVVREWRSRRAQKGVDFSTMEMTNAPAGGGSEISVPSNPPSHDEVIGGHGLDEGDDDASAMQGADVPLPPENGFRPFFVVRLFRRDGGDDAVESDDVTDAGAASITLHDDGAFEIHAPPGRYRLEAVSRDGFLAGERAEVNAVPGDVEDGLDIGLAPTVALAGRVLDQDGVLVPSMVTLAAVGRDDGTAMMGDGTFRFDDLKPGAFRLTAGAGENQTTATFLAPMNDIVLHVARAGAGLLVLPPGPDGRCGRATVLATPHTPNAAVSSGSSLQARVTAHRRRWMYTAGCQALIEPAAPGSVWDVLVIGLEQKPIEAQVQFGFGSPAAPVCLRAGCSTDTAALRVVSIDVDGRELDATATVLASAPGGPAVGSTISRLLTAPANQGITIEVRAGALALQRQLWLLPGLNRAVVQFPRRARELTDGDAAEIE